MSSYAIVTDTDSSLPQAIAARFGIRQVPINIHFEQRTYRAGVDLNDAALCALVDSAGRMPTTSAPTPGQFAEAFEAALAEGAAGVVCLTVSALGSATYTAAEAACQMLPGREITIVDTRSATLGQGFMVLAAAEAAAAGAGKDEIIAQALAVRERTHLFAALSTLKYLAMSGRVGQLSAGVATLLNIKPVLTMTDGQLKLLERVRTQSKAWARVIELTVAATRGVAIERLAIIHANAPAAAVRFEEQLRAVMACPAHVLLAELTPGLTAVSGAGLVGVVCVTAGS